MKVRRDFVTNSSSSSFIISKKHLDDKQITAIWRHSTLGKKLGISCFNDDWNINENEDFITGYTYMDNFDMFEFLEKIDVNMNFVNWSEFSFDLDTYEDSNEDHTEDNETVDVVSWRDLLDED